MNWLKFVQWVGKNSKLFFGTILGVALSVIGVFVWFLHDFLTSGSWLK